MKEYHEKLINLGFELVDCRDLPIHYSFEKFTLIDFAELKECENFKEFEVKDWTTKETWYFFEIDEAIERCLYKEKTFVENNITYFLTRFYDGNIKYKIEKKIELSESLAKEMWEKTINY